MSHQLVVKTRLGETQICLVVLDILNSTVGWWSHIDIFWELKKKLNKSHSGFSIMIQRLAQAKPSSWSRQHKRAVAAKPCWLMVGMISQFMKWESLWKSAMINLMKTTVFFPWKSLGFQPYENVESCWHICQSATARSNMKQLLCSNSQATVDICVVLLRDYWYYSQYILNHIDISSKQLLF